MGRRPELVGPLSSSRTPSRLTAAKAGGGVLVDGEAEVGGVEGDGGRDVVDHVADADRGGGGHVLLRGVGLCALITTADIDIR
jgi:hypothetical protein